MSATIVNGTWLSGKWFPPVRYVVPGIIPEGLTLLVAPPKAGKSWLVYAIAIARASGGIVLGQRIDPGPVLYLALEDGHRRLRERGHKLIGPSETLPAALEFIIKVEPGTVIATMTEWLAAHRGENPMVIVDTLGRVKPSARNGQSAYEHDYAVLAALKSLVDDDPGSSMVLVHHDRKAASEDFVDAVSGTNGIAGAADTTVVIKRPRTEGEAVIAVTGRDVDEAEYAATFVGGKWSLAGGNLGTARDQAVVSKATTNLGDRSADIIAAVGRAEGPSTIAEVAESTGLTTDQAKDYLGRLAREGKLQRPKRGTYALTLSQLSQVSPPTDQQGESDTSEGCDTPSGELCLIAGCTRPRAGANLCADHDTETTPSVNPCGHPGKLGPTGKCAYCLTEPVAS